MTRPAITTTERAQALWVTIDRPDRANAINDEVLTGIADACDRAGDRDDLRAVVLTAAGEKVFCAGADLSSGTENLAHTTSGRTGFGELAHHLEGFPKPIVGRVNGACVAGGHALLALCDVVVAADHATFHLPESRVGVFPYQVIALLNGRISSDVLRYMCLSGRRIDASRAREAGLVTIVADSQELDSQVDAFVADLAAGAPRATAQGLRAMAVVESLDRAAALEYAQAQIAIAAVSDEAVEGRAAFRERRAPAWMAASL